VTGIVVLSSDVPQANDQVLQLFMN
jgi:hypothetical protein